MKTFNAPRMERINLASQNTIFTSDCMSNYCDGHTCPNCDPAGCEGFTGCPIQSACSAFNCGHYLCPQYIG